MWKNWPVTGIISYKGGKNQGFMDDFTTGYVIDILIKQKAYFKGGPYERLEGFFAKILKG